MASKDNTLFMVKKEPPESQDEDREKTDVKSALDHPDLHSFYFCEKGKKGTMVSCTKAGTVLQVLKRNDLYDQLVSKNEGKNIVLEREQADSSQIASHFPCWLIETDEELTIHFKPGPVHPQPLIIPEMRKAVILYVDCRHKINWSGKKVLRHKYDKDHNLCIYAYIGETIEDALRRDGRFDEDAFTWFCHLSCSGEKYARNQLVFDKLNERKFRLHLQKAVKKRPSDSTTKTNSGSLTTEQAAGPMQKPGESPPRSLGPASAKPSAQELEKSTPQSDEPAPATPAQELGQSTPRSDKPAPFHVMPDSKEILAILRSQFPGLVEIMKGREMEKGGEREVLELLREEFGKNIKIFWDVWRVKDLMLKGDTVCLFLNDSDGLEGTGFLLFDRFVLTNAHLIKDLNAHACVIFHYDKEPRPHYEYLSVKEIIAWFYGPGEECWLDYALLELDIKTTVELPPGLLAEYGPPVQSGGVCIIGHPEGGVKRVDFCSVIECKQRDSVTEKNQGIIQWLKWDDLHSKVISYDTCFFNGSSGSPVFDGHGNVVAMHTAGCKLNDTETILEFAIPLQSVLKDLVRQVVDKPRLDILAEFTEVAKAHDALHPFIADLITFIMKNWKPQLLDVLRRVIEVVERDTGLRDRCWKNTLQNMSNDAQCELKVKLVEILNETQRSECQLYRLLVQPVEL